jgi:hypothetical protein
MIGTIFGRKAAFCNPGCRDSFKCDRQHGLNYGLSLIEDETTIYVAMDREQLSLAAECCAYCSNSVEVPKQLMEDADNKLKVWKTKIPTNVKWQSAARSRPQ